MFGRHFIFKYCLAAALLAASIDCTPQVQTQFVAQTTSPAAVDTPLTVVVLGSSLAAGWVTSYERLHDLQNGYVSRLSRALEQEGYTVVNHSIPGNTSADVLERMHENMQVTEPDFVLIGLSLGNERLDQDRDAAVAAYSKNLPEIIERCRMDNRIPIVGLCYAYDAYDTTDYAYLKRMNLAIDGWGVPTINFLGTVEDGGGRFVETYTFEGTHPNNRGHEELFLAIVPSLFEVLSAKKPVPARPEKPKHTTIERDKHGRAPMSYVPDDPIHSFALGFSVRTKQGGAVAAVATGGGFATVALAEDGKPVYTSSSGATIAGPASLTDGDWHNVVLSHRYPQGKSMLFVDGRLVGETMEKIEPRQFILGGSGRDESDAPDKADYRDWLVYRSALNDFEVDLLHKRGMFNASMEVYAPLAKENPKHDRALENRAWSTSTAIAMPTDVATNVAVLNEKIEAADEARKDEFGPEEKETITVDAATLETYTGKYEIAPGDAVDVIADDGHLYVIDGEDKIELFAESPNKFFIKTVGYITITFVKESDGTISRLILGAHGQEIPAARID